MSNNKSNSGINIHSRGSGGSTNIPTYTTRKTKIFAINEAELDAIYNYNITSTVYFSISTFFLSILIESLMHPIEVVRYVYLGFVAIIVVFFGFGIRACYSKRSLVGKIKEESETIN